MKRILLSLGMLAIGSSFLQAQEVKIAFQEYDLPNGLHVILHQDHNTPIVSVSVMYHVGSKNEDSSRTGFAHFFEHLLFEGSENLGRNEFMATVQENGGMLNANTSQDRTYYFEVLPSNLLELGLWLESERMLHAKIDSIGIETQRGVVKEEKKQSYDNRPYGQIMNVTFENAYTTHPYRWTPIGKEQYIDEASYEEFMDFYHQYYVPNNAVLVLAGDFDLAQAKAWVEKYFGTIPRGADIKRPEIAEPQQKKERRATFYDNVQLPAVIMAYHGPKKGADDYYALELLNLAISGSNSSRFDKQIVDKDEKAVGAASFLYPLEDPGLVFAYGIAAPGVTPEELEKAMNREIEKLKSSGITPAEFAKIQNQVEKSVIAQNARISGIAENLATNYTFFGNTNLINSELNHYQKITPEDLKRAANKYLNKENRTVIYYLPKK